MQKLSCWKVNRSTEAQAVLCLSWHQTTMQITQSETKGSVDKSASVRSLSQQLCTYVRSELQEAGTTHCGERHGHFRCPLVGTCYAIPICWFLNMPGLTWIPLGPDLIKNHREHACDRSWCLWKLEPGVGQAPVVWKLSDQSVSWPCLIKVSLSQKTMSWHSESLMCCAYVGPKPWGHWTPLN